MERTKTNQGEVNVNIQAYAELVARANLAERLGYQYSGDRDIYESLGYKTTLSIADYFTQYRRQDIAKAVVNRPISATWKGAVSVLDSTDDNETQFEKDYSTLDEELKLKSVFVRFDKLISLGRYAVLLLGFDDVQKKDDWGLPVSGGKRKLLYLKPKSELTAKIETYEKDPNSPRFGKPLLYRVTIADIGTNSQSDIMVHYTRVLHAANEILEDETIGTSVLESVFNRLKDLEKLVGGSAEMFWRGARPGYVAKADKDYGIDPATDTEFRTMVDEYEHKLRRILITEGYDISSLESQVSNPKDHVDVQIQMISAITQIPKRILTGSERGELSSSQDADNWLGYIQTRREEYAEQLILRPFIDLCIKHGVLSKPTEQYSIDWGELLSQSEKEKADIGKVKSEILKNYVSSGAEYILPVEAFLEYIMGFTQEQIELTKERIDAQIQEEPLVSPQERQMIDEQEQEEENE